MRNISQNLFNSIVVEAQVNTQQYGGRPFGVGLLIAGVDVKKLN